MSESRRVRVYWSRSAVAAAAPFLGEEWIVTNGQGGYASGTIFRETTRRYHGLLVAALPTPFGRMMMLNHLEEHVRFGAGGYVSLLDPGLAHLESFALELGLPIWRYRFDHHVLEKRIFMAHGANTTHLVYRLLAGASPARLRLRPGLHFRGHEAAVGVPDSSAYQMHTTGQRVEIRHGDVPPLKLQMRSGDSSLVVDASHLEVEYALEHERGYPHRDMLWSPGYFRAELTPGGGVDLTASTESWDAIGAMQPEEALGAELERRERLIAQATELAHGDICGDLVLAADQFIITPTTRLADEVRARAAGDEARSVIAGYHWFTDWGRDTMISLEGLTLVTGRSAEAGFILRTFGQHVRDGLIPNMFPEGVNTGLYHTADATLWYFHALDRYLRTTQDESTLKLLLPTLQEIVARHLAGTHFGIHVDPADGLLSQGEAGYQLTWMDAKVDGWVVTPRRGKAVEINALWYNALRLLAGWLMQEGQPDAARDIDRHAEAARVSFNERFWCAERGWLYDVIDCIDDNGDRTRLDASLRPNQLLAISLPHPVLAEPYWPHVLSAVREHLLTPFGLRTLAPFEPDYKPRYFGDLRARDAAYHQGTVWAWLLGPYVDAARKLGNAQRVSLTTLSTAFARHLAEAGVGTISEIFDAEPPYTARGCISQAWSVAEVLRSCVNLAQDEADRERR
ncbi:MAG: amylo-alpha-1,6-glucosidase [Pirellulales bacterium]